MTSKTVCITQEGPANALALNKDNSQVVIAGRNGIFNTKYTIRINKLDIRNITLVIYVYLCN